MNDRSDAAAEEPELTYELKSVKEAADLLRVSESTVWRYANQDLLPAYRIGRKRVMFRRGDLEALLNRLRGRQPGRRETVNTNDRLRLSAMSAAADTAGALARAKTLQAEILARRGGVPVSGSWEDINAAREERTAEL